MFGKLSKCNRQAEHKHRVNIWEHAYIPKICIPHMKIVWEQCCRCIYLRLISRKLRSCSKLQIIDSTAFITLGQRALSLNHRKLVWYHLVRWIQILEDKQQSFCVEKTIKDNGSNPPASYFAKYSSNLLRVWSEFFYNSLRQTSVCIDRWSLYRSY